MQRSGIRVCLKVAEKSRITLRFIQATGMRSTSARDVVRVKDIGNKRVQGHGLHFYRDIGHGFTLDVSFIKASECDRPEIHIPDPIIDLFQPNRLVFEQV
jgi:hypothetical protein